MTPWEQRADAVLRRLQGLEAPAVAELGFGAGKMSKVLLARHAGLHLTLVDSFLEGTAQPARYRETGDDFARQDAAAVAKHKALAERLVAEYADRAVLHHADTSVAADLIEDASLDLVFIDADHSFEGVKWDILRWHGKVRPGGWIGGHDYGNATDPRFDFGGVKRAADLFGDTFGVEIETDANFTWFARL